MKSLYYRGSALNEYRNPNKEINVLSELCENYTNLCDNVVFINLSLKNINNSDFFRKIADRITLKQYEVEDNSEFIKPHIFYSTGFNLFSSNTNIKFDERYRFLDSSIWLNYVYIPTDDDTSKDNIINVFEKIQKNYENGLYDKKINKESFVFHSYLMKNVFGENRNIKPFTFHSETKIKEELSDFLKEGIPDDKNFHINTIDLKWKFLLIAEIDDILLANKKNIIKKLLNCIAHEDKSDKEPPDLNPTNNLLYSITTVQSITDALVKLEEEQYDIILLDYLLRNGGKGAELVKILEENAKTYKKGPFGRHWIFPVTVFSEALFNELRELRLGHLNNNSYVNRGADPYNTPYLFLYKLVSFMNLQLKEVVFTIPHLILLFQTFLDNVNNDKNNIKRSAGASYGELMYRFGKKSMIAYDRKENSFLAESLYNNYLRNDLDGVLQKFEHIREFLYLLAFGGDDDRTKLISELVFINEQIKPLLLSELGTEDNEKYKSIGKSFNKLNNYIYNL